MQRPGRTHGPLVYSSLAPNVTAEETPLAPSSAALHVWKPCVCSTCSLSLIWEDRSPTAGTLGASTRKRSASDLARTGPLMGNKRWRFLLRLLVDNAAFLISLNVPLGRERFVNTVCFPASLLPCQNVPMVPSLNARIPDNNIPFSVVSSHCVCRIPLVSAPAGTHAHRDTPPRFRARAPAFNPCLYPPHPRRCGDYPASHCIFF